MQTTITWIPTDVELPDDSTVVLVALESGDEPTWIGYYDSAECDWFNSDGMRFKSAVSHWCELPVLVDLERQPLSAAEVDLISATGASRRPIHGVVMRRDSNYGDNDTDIQHRA